MIFKQTAAHSDPRFKIFHELMSHKIREILFVSSPYDAWVMEKDRGLSEAIVLEYQGLNLSHPPRLNWVASINEASAVLKDKKIDLIIIMSQAAEFQFVDVYRLIRKPYPSIPIVRLYHRAPGYMVSNNQEGIPFTPERTLMWSGDTKLLLAVIKSIEDQINSVRDTQLAAIRVIIFVEDSPDYLSSLLPLLYQELVSQTQAVIEEGLNHEHRLLTMRARPKILIAQTFEEATKLFETFEPYVLAVISDVRFPRGGIHDGDAGIQLLSTIHRKRFDIPLLLASSEVENRDKAATIPAAFVDKNSPDLHEEVHSFFLDKLGFGPFLFERSEKGAIRSAANLFNLERGLRFMSDQTFYNHWVNNDFSRWLFTRAETLLATELRSVTKDDFNDDLSEMRKYLYNKFHDWRLQRQKGVLVDFDEEDFESETEFVKIGGGSLGGKARGLAFFSSWLYEYPSLRNKFSQLEILIPQTLIITTECFEKFIKSNNLRHLSRRDLPNDEIARYFVNGEFPSTFRNQLKIYLEHVNCPIAVRSSSLLEDAKFRAYAGLYKTYMLANDNSDLDLRLEQLINSIKMVFASTYYREPKSFSRRVGNRIEEERMAVIVQQIAGDRYREFFYPAISGVAQSYNFYPFSRLKPEDGVATIAVGMGKSVTEGEKSLRFSPGAPQILPQFSSVDDILKNCQRSFYALKMKGPDSSVAADDSMVLVKRDITDGVDEYPVQILSSSYDAQEHRIRDSYSGNGSPVITFSSVLKYGTVPLAEILAELLSAGQKGMGGPVEIEFSIVLTQQQNKKPQVYILQIRPMGSQQDTMMVDIDSSEVESLFCLSHNSLGNSINHDIHDIIYVKPDAFEPSRTVEISKEISYFNGIINEAGRKYLLVGPGRWGSADRWLGIPVSWADISGVGGIVETYHSKISAEPSQGSHFFHNITSLGINYLTVVDPKNDFIDWDWISSLSLAHETKYIGHVRRETPFILRVDGRNSLGALYK
jgi:hypothetical protein